MAFTKERLLRLLANNTGQDFEKIKIDCERDYWLTADKAKDYGLIDQIVEKH